MSGIKGRSGRRRTATNELKLRLDKLERIELSHIIDNLVLLASGNPLICPHCNLDTLIRVDIDITACTYLIDRIMGKPKQSTDMTITDRIVLSADQALKILARARLQAIAFDNTKALPSPSDSPI